MHDFHHYRIGQGYDVHALVPERSLILGGVHIPFEKGLQGHSDGDVLLHAVTDALLGAAALRDIGYHFPDTDPRYKGADSRQLLRAAVALVKQAGWTPVNLDVTVIVQRPHLSSHIPAICASLSEDTGLPLGCVNVKAKTNEKLGYLGRNEAIEAQAIVLLCATEK